MLGSNHTYLEGHTRLREGSTLSHPAALQYGAPRALSLVQFFSLSTLTQSAQSFIPTVVLYYYFYADDTQLYITLSPANFSNSIQKLKNCLNDIQNFMFTNKLKLNPDKTKLIFRGSQKNHKQLLPHFPISILGNQVSPAQSVRNLGVVFPWPKLPRVSEKLHLVEYILFTINTKVYLQSDL